MRPVSLTTAQLSRLWRYTPKIINQAVRDGTLAADERGKNGRPPYSFYNTSIDAVHRRALSAHGSTAQIPSVIELVYHTITTGEPALMTSGEAMAFLEVGRRTLQELVASNQVVCFQPLGSGRWLFPAALLAEYKCERKASEPTPARGLTPRYVEFMTGLSVYSIADFRQGGVELEGTKDSRSHGFSITHASLTDYLRRHLAKDSAGNPHLTPMQWCVLRATRRDKLLTRGDVRRTCSVTDTVIEVAITSGELPCIWTPGNALRVPAHAVQLWPDARQ